MRAEVGAPTRTSSPWSFCHGSAPAVGSLSRTPVWAVDNNQTRYSPGVFFMQRLLCNAYVSYRLEKQKINECRVYQRNTDKPKSDNPLHFSIPIQGGILKPSKRKPTRSNKIYFISHSFRNPAPLSCFSLCPFEECCVAFLTFPANLVHPFIRPPGRPQQNRKHDKPYRLVEGSFVFCFTYHQNGSFHRHRCRHYPVRHARQSLRARFLTPIFT